MFYGFVPITQTRRLSYLSLPASQIFPRRTVTQHTVRMTFIVMLERHRQILHCRMCIRTRHNADIVTLYRLHKAFCHAITLHTAVLFGSSPSNRANRWGSCAL